MSTNSVTVANAQLPFSPLSAQSTVLSDVQLEARKRLDELNEAKFKAQQEALNEAKFKAQQEADLKASRLREEDFQRKKRQIIGFF